MRAEDCKWAPSFQINDLPRALSVRRPPVCGQRRGFFLEDDMRNSTTTVGLALAEDARRRRVPLVGRGAPCQGKKRVWQTRSKKVKDAAKPT